MCFTKKKNSFDDTYCTDTNFKMPKKINLLEKWLTARMKRRWVKDGPGSGTYNLVHEETLCDSTEEIRKNAVK